MIKLSEEMLTRFNKFITLVFVIPFLSACVGGGGGGTTRSFSSWDSITYPSTVTASGVSYEGTYTYSTSTGNLTSVGVASAASSPQVSLTYNSSGVLTAASISTSSQTQSYDSFSAANSDGSLMFALKTSDGSDWALATDPASNALDWKYQAFGVWTDPDSSGSGKYGSISVGSQTTGSSIPASSSATFSGYGGGFYTDSSNNAYVVQSAVSATANFATRQVSLSSTSTGKQQYSNGSFGSYGADSNLNFSGTLSYSANTNSMSGTLTTTSGMSGPSQARFYGPNAEEIGGVFNLTGGSQTFVGGFGAKQ